ncbi:MAG TPA: DUF167 family protein [Candidatus Eisenbacteria bacterium]|nr:DUF167 family protein [Candidatus Eisenbacteria bacterium]
MRIQVHVTPKSRANEILVSREDGIVRVRVTEAPEDGRANQAVLELLRERLGLPRDHVRVAGGATSRRKWIEVDGLEEAEVWRRLEGQR